MITTANYIVKVVAEGETYVFEYDTDDMWTALKEFWHDDWEWKFAHIEKQCFALDVLAMEDGKVIKTYELAFEMSYFHHFYDHGDCTLDEFYNGLRRCREELEKVKYMSDVVTKFMFYMWNRWCEEECKEVFGKDDFYPHFWNKWCGICKMLGTAHGAAEMFYAELSDRNRDKLVRRAVEYYNEQNH